MDVNLVFFELGPVLKLIFRLNYIPKVEAFKELIPSQYDAFYVHAAEQEIKDINNKPMLAFIPDEPTIYKRVMEVLENEQYVITEDQLGYVPKKLNLNRSFCRNKWKGRFGYCA